MASQDTNTYVARRVVRGLARNGPRNVDGSTSIFIRDIWAAAKRFGAVGIRDVYPHMVKGLAEQVVAAPLDETNRATVAGLCLAVQARSIFEFGTHRGLTSWTVAHNNPEATVYTLDVPAGMTLSEVSLDSDPDEESFSGSGDLRGEAFRQTPEAARITALEGDSATFDYLPYQRMMDVIYVDGGHSYAHVMNDTRAAQTMLKPGGLIVWDDYPWWPGVYSALTELAPVLPGKMFHILMTRLVVYSEREMVS